MRFFCLMPVRDEGDIIGETLARLLTWADSIHVFDNGSIDETWEIVEEWARKDERIVPLRKDPVYFSDWFLRVDADEIHHVPPPEFVKTRLRRHETVVWHQYYDFRLTGAEVRHWEDGAETRADRLRPIEDRRRWYTPSVYAEPRMCRYRESMRWPATASFPYNAGFLARERLPIRHYPHRDPAQLDRRCRLRAVMRADPAWDPGAGSHWSVGEWRKFITPDDHPGMQYWRPGTELPEVRWTNHLPPPHKRAIQRLVHAVALPLLDPLRPGWVEGTYPGKIPGDVVRRMERELAPDFADTSRVCT
jgi:hypothetical protein